MQTYYDLYNSIYNEKDLLYARASGIKIFDETVKEFNYKLSGMVDIEKEIEQLKERNPHLSNVIQEEYNYINIVNDKFLTDK